MEEQQNNNLSWTALLSFVKKNLSIFSACLTVFISLFVAVINFFDYLNDRIVLFYWSISFDFISFSHKGFLYKIALSIILIISLVMYFYVMGALLSKYFFDGSGTLFYNYAIRYYRSSLNASRLRNRISTIKLKRLYKKSSDTSIQKEIDTLKESIQETQKLIEDTSAGLDALDKHIKPKHVEKRYKFALKISIAIVLLALFFFTIILYYFPDNMVNNFKVSLAFALSFSFIHFLYYKTISIMYNRNNIQGVSMELDDEAFDRLMKSIYLKKPYGLSKKRLLQWL